tara:strand:+ start:6399 stop:6917 length:519 start_codon:yes stop_codon:yes gene_type:complete
MRDVHPALQDERQGSIQRPDSPLRSSPAGPRRRGAGEVAREEADMRDMSEVRERLRAQVDAEPVHAEMAANSDDLFALLSAIDERDAIIADVRRALHAYSDSDLVSLTKATYRQSMMVDDLRDSLAMAHAALQRIRDTTVSGLYPAHWEDDGDVLDMVDTALKRTGGYDDEV